MEILKREKHGFYVAMSEKEFNQLFCALCGQTVNDLKKYSEKYNLEIPTPATTEDMKSYYEMKKFIVKE